jgi:hypothetical protein
MLMLLIQLFIERKKSEIRGPVLNFEVQDSRRDPAVLEPNNKTDNLKGKYTIYVTTGSRPGGKYSIVECGTWHPNPQTKAGVGVGQNATIASWYSMPNYQLPLHLALYCDKMDSLINCHNIYVVAIDTLRLH